MNTTEQRVIACVDQSAYAESVTDHAAWVAQRLGAPLELLHVIDRHPETAQSQDHSGALGPDAQAALLSQLSDADEAMVRAAREQGRLFLNRLRERALGAGVAQVDVRQRLGHLDETLHEAQSEARLVVLGRRGASAAGAEGGLGGHVERVVRALERAVLVVPSAAFKAPERVLLAFDGSAATRKGIEIVAGSPLFRGLAVKLVVVGDGRSGAQAQMAWASDCLTQGGLMVESEMASGGPVSSLLAALERHTADWLLMGAYTHSPWRNLFRSSRTRGLLASAAVPALLLR